MRVVLFVIVILLACSRSLMAQSSYDDQNVVSIPSPNNDFLKSQPDFSVNLFSGVPIISIPLYTLTSKELTLPIALNYTSGGGIKIQDIAGFTGLGWQLSAGGYISRVVRGFPDEQTKGYIGTNLYGQTINAGLTNTVITQVGTGMMDGEPDLFNIRTPNFAFTFVLDQYGNPVFPNNTGLKISPNNFYNTNSSNNTNTSWVVTDADGTQYFFGSTPASRENSTATLAGTETSFTSTWYLDKIVSFNSKDMITLTYQSGSDYSVLHFLQSQTSFVSGSNCSAPATINTTYSDTVTYNSPKYISKIVSSLGEVDFTYAFDRQDFPTAARLASLTVYPYDPATLAVTTALKTFQFNYGYYGTPSTDPNVLRLQLDNISLLSSISTDPPLTYKSFNYNTTALPSRQSVQFDYWGYYNANSSGTSIIPAANKNPDPTNVQAGLLIAVHDLSGEVQQLQYEPNMYLNGSTNTASGGVRIKQLTKTLPSGETLSTSYQYTNASGNSTGQIDQNNLYYTNLTKAINILIPAGGGTFCAIAGTNTSSESLYNTFDLDGVIVGYSSVKIVSPNGGYEIDQFTNFNLYPDVFTNATSDGSVYGFSGSRQLSAGTSYAYKRGLLLAKTVYTSSGYPIDSTTYNYGSLDQLTAKALGVRVALYTYLTSSFSDYIYGSYYNNFENFVPTQTSKYIFTQNSRSLVQQITTNLTYAANHRLIQRLDYTDSKGLSRSKITYHTEDAGIPGLTGDQQYAIDALLTANCTNAVIHTTDIHNGTSQDTHYGYLYFLDPSLNSKVLLGNKATSVNHSTQVEEQQYQYDPSSSNLTSINKLGGPFLSTQYGYSQSYMTAKVKNAVNLSSVAISQAIEPGQFSYIPGTELNPESATFSIGYLGTFTLNLTYQGSSGSGVLTTFNYTLAGPSPQGGNLCVSTNNSCAFPSSVTFSNLAPGSYTLTVNQTVDNAPTNAYFVKYSYPSITPSLSTTNEFYYEGFEFNSSASTATPYAGKRYYTGAFTVPFTIPDSRSYQVDYHYLLNGVWYAQTKPYTNNMVLNDGSAVDEVRVHPVDALMTTYTYSPLNGVTSIGDTRNRFTFYIYDGFGRLSQINDNDGNILSAYDYQYQVPLGQTCQKPVITSVTETNSTMTISYLPSPNSGACNVNIFDQTTGATVINSTGGCTSPVTFNIPTSTNIYVVKVTSYTSDCSSGVTSVAYTVTP